MELLLSNPEVVHKRLYVKRGIDWDNKDARQRYKYENFLTHNHQYYCECCDVSIRYNAQYKHKASAKHLKNLEKLNNDLSN